MLFPLPFGAKKLNKNSTRKLLAYMPHKIPKFALVSMDGVQSEYPQVVPIEMSRNKRIYTSIIEHTWSINIPLVL